MNGVVLTKQSGADELRKYFNAVQQLRSSGREFPVDLDDVWPLVYPRKDYAVSRLKKMFLQGVDYERVHTNVEANNAKKDKYYISVSAMEFIIARKVRAVFEVYRQVFHKAVSEEALPQSYPDALRRLAQQVEENERLLAEAQQRQIELDDSRQRNQMLQGENEAQQKQILVLAPKAQFTDEVLQSTETLTFTEVAKDMGFGSACALLKRLRCLGIVFRQGDKWLPMAEYSRKGYFSTRTARWFNSKGEPQSSTYTVVTQRGRYWLGQRIGGA